MATETKGLKFFHVDGLSSVTAPVDGGIYFDKKNGELAVRNGSEWEKYSGNVKNVVYDPVVDKKGNAVGGKLNITYFDGNSVELDFTVVASKTQVAEDIKTAKAAAVTEAKNYVNARKVNGKTLNNDIVLDGRDIKLDGYSKPASTGAIAATDTVNQALGKLEKAIEFTDGNALTKVNAGNGISVTDKGSGHEQTISAKIDTASEKFGENAVLTAGPDGLKISGIKNAIDTAIGGLDVDDAAVANKYVSSVSETDGKISVTRADLPVIGVADNDKILSLSGAKIGADLSLTYDKGAKKIYLYGKNKTNVSDAISTIDCTDFIKDGMLKDASYSDSTHILTLTFNSDAGDKTIDVNLSGLVDTYAAGDGIKLENLETDTHPTFKINLADGGKYLGIVDGKLRLDDNAIHTKISGDITTAINGLTSDAANTAAGAGADASTQIKVTVSEAAGKLTGVTVNAPIFATPSDITTAENRLIGSSTTDTKGSNTIWGAKRYADDAAAGALKDAKTYTDTKIQALDVTKDQVASATEGLALHVKQEDGVITEFSGSMNWCEW